MMQFLWLYFSGVGGSLEEAEAPQISHPGAGVRFVVIQHFFLIVRMLLQFPEIEFPGPRRF